MAGERVALIHSYLGDREVEGKPDRLTRVGLLAAAELYRKDKIDKICITVEPELSDPQIKRLKRLLGIKLQEEDLVVEPVTVTTRGEVNTFRSLAEKNQWGDLVTIGNQAHLPRINREIRRAFGEKNINIEAKSSEDILSEYPRYAKILEDMKSWPEQSSLSINEKLLSIPVVGNIISEIAKAPFLSRYKVYLQTWVFRQIEKLK